MLGVSFELILYLDEKEIGRRWYDNRVKACDMGHRWRELRRGQFPDRGYEYQVQQVPPRRSQPVLFRLEFYCDSNMIGRREYTTETEARHLAQAWLLAARQNRPGHNYTCRFENPAGVVQVLRE